MAKHILVLSSKPEVIQRLRDTLELQGYVVRDLPADVDVAVAVTNTGTGQKPELVILAPGLANSDLAAYESRNVKRLGGSSNPARPRVLLLSIRTEGESIMEYDTGADMYLVEEFVPAELLAFVRRLIGPAEE